MKKALLFGALALAGVIALPATSALAKKRPAPSPRSTPTMTELSISRKSTSLRLISLRSLEKDADGTVDIKEMKGRVSKKDFKTADPDNDGTLSKDEFLTMVSTLFKDADPDNDGTLDAKELASKKGKALLRVTR